MCTAATYKTKDFYFGRTLDYEFSYGDQVTVTPRNFPFYFRHAGDLTNHYAIIGMAHVADNYPCIMMLSMKKGLVWQALILWGMLLILKFRQKGIILHSLNLFPGF